MMLAQAKTMTQRERLQAMEELWDMVCHDDAALMPPEWHKSILADRKEKIKSGKATFISLRELKTIAD